MPGGDQEFSRPGRGTGGGLAIIRPKRAALDRVGATALRRRATAIRPRKCRFHTSKSASSQPWPTLGVVRQLARRSGSIRAVADADAVDPGVDVVGGGRRCRGFRGLLRPGVRDGGGRCRGRVLLSPPQVVVREWSDTLRSSLRPMMPGRTGGSAGLGHGPGRRRRSVAGRGA